MKLVGIDIGTTSICAVVVDTQLRSLVHSTTVPNLSRIEPSEPYEFLQDPNRIWLTVQGLVDDILGRYPDIVAIGVSGQMHGIIYVNGHGDAVSPLYTWQDGRGNLQMPDGSTYVEALQHLTGYQVASGYGLVTHFYQVCTRGVPSDAASLCTIGDFVVMKLTGEAASVMDATNAASLGLFQSGQFDWQALEAAGLNDGIIPDVVSCPTRAGTHASGVPVFTAIGDNQASFLGAVPALKGTLLVNIGTGAQVSMWSEQTREAPGWEVRPFLGNGSLYVGATLGGGKSYALLERFFRDTCRIFTGLETDNLYSRMDEVIHAVGESVEGNVPNSLVVDPQFFGTRTDAARRGVISNISESNFTPGRLMWAWIDGMAAELWNLYRSLPSEVCSSITRLCGSGNGIRKNQALCRAIERHFKLPVTLSPFEEEAAVGAALYAGVGAQVFPDIHAVGTMVGRS